MAKYQCLHVLMDVAQSFKGMFLEAHEISFDLIMYHKK